MRILLPMVLLAVLAACTPETAKSPTEPVFIPDIAEVSKNVRTIKFGLYASGKPTQLIKDFSPILQELEAYLTERLETPVKITIHLSKTYEEGVDVIVSGIADFSRFGPASYTEAYNRNPNIDVLAMERGPDGEKVFYGIVAIAKNSTIISVDQLVGESFAFGDDQSTIGRYLAQQHLVANGVTAGNLGGFDYLGRHDKVGEAVGRGEYVAGALNERTFQQLVSSGVQIKELARFENVTKPWISSGTLDEGLENMIREGLLQITDSRSTRRLGFTGFVEGDDTDYVTIRESILNNSEFFEGYTNPE